MKISNLLATLALAFSTTVVQAEPDFDFPPDFGGGDYQPDFDDGILPDFDKDLYPDLGGGFHPDLDGPPVHGQVLCISIHEPSGQTFSAAGRKWNASSRALTACRDWAQHQGGDIPGTCSLLDCHAFTDEI